MFIPLHLLPPYEARPRAQLPVTESLAQRGFSLPTASTMGTDDALEVIRRLRKALRTCT